MDSSRREKTILMVGETMLILQKIEQFLLASLLHMSTGTEADQKFEKVLLRDKETLGRLIDHFSKRFEVPLQFAEAFDDLLERRNLFVHNLAMAPWFDLKSDEGCAVLDDYMREIRVSAKVVLHVLIAAAFDETATLASPEVAARKARIVAKLVETAEPDFGGLTEEQYVRRGVVNAEANYGVKRRGT